MPVVNLNPWSYEYIRQLAQEATLFAQRDGLRPALASEVVMTYRLQHRFNIPFLGDYVPQGWVRIDEGVFVDTTGRATPNELTRTQEEFHRQITNDRNVGYGVVERAQTQVLVATYRRKV